MNNAGIKRFEYDWVLILWLTFEDAVRVGRLSWRVFADQYLPDGGRGWVVLVSCMGHSDEGFLLSPHWEIGIVSIIYNYSCDLP